MNWGYKILIVYLIFVTGILYMVYRSSAQNQDLVTPDYYEQELAFQDRIDQTVRANALSAPVRYELQPGGISVLFPPELIHKKITAQAWLYCITDKSKDIKKEITTEDGKVFLPIPSGSKGSYELKTTWKVDGKGYYFEYKISIP
jgi:hypothetical protein